MYDLGIIGGGASGLAAAIVAEKRGKKVIIFEKEDKVGKKISGTGNGKCNLSAVDVTSDKYNTEFVKGIITEDVVGFFKEIGLATKVVGTRIYPYHESASGVVAVLRKNLKNTEIKTNCQVKEIVKSKGGFSINGIACRSVALCTGSVATKGTSSYALYEKFGHGMTELKPSIVPLVTDSEDIKGLANLRAKVRLTLIRNGERKEVQEGEILFKEDGLSGICSMMLSTYIARKGGKNDVSVDFAPDKSEKEIETFVKEHDLEGMILKPISQKIIRYANRNKIGIGKAVKDFIIKNVKNGGVKNAQVMCGGLNEREFDEKCESKKEKGLYACGEVLNVDGECGGYNLHFAFASGIKVGKNI